MRRLIQRPRSVAAESLHTALTIWKLGAVPSVLIAIACSVYALNKFEPFLLMGGMFVVSGLLGAACCWVKAVPSWLIYWFRLRG